MPWPGRQPPLVVIMSRLPPLPLETHGPLYLESALPHPKRLGRAFRLGRVPLQVSICPTKSEASN